jgi:hypothetical protein
MSDERITLKANMTVKESVGIKNLQQRAVAGLTEEELIERHTIGKLDESTKPGADTQGN